MWKLNPRKWLTWYFEHCAASEGKVPENIQLFLPWNLSEEQKKELGTPDPLKGMTLHRSTCIPAPEFSHRETQEPAPP